MIHTMLTNILRIGLIRLKPMMSSLDFPMYLFKYHQDIHHLMGIIYLYCYILLTKGLYVGYGCLLETLLTPSFKSQSCIATCYVNNE